jgi:CBS-domain-containing membrane protein
MGITAEIGRLGKKTPESGSEPVEDDTREAMVNLSGYVDVTADDFQEIFELAYRHAHERLTASMTAEGVMRGSTAGISADATLEEAVLLMAQQQTALLPVSDDEGVVRGVLTQTDVLRLLEAATPMELIAHSLDEPRQQWKDSLRSSRVADLMTTPAVTVPGPADATAMLERFKKHGINRMPVVNESGRLLGVVSRNDLVAACDLDLPADTCPDPRLASSTS